MCRCAIVDPDGDFRLRSCEEEVDALPTDLAMAAVVESAVTLSRPATCPVHSVKSRHNCSGRTHGVTICHLCATEEHSACPEVTALEKRLEEARSALAELWATLSAGESELEQAINRLDQPQLEESERRVRVAVRVEETQRDAPCLMRVGVVSSHPSGLTLPWTAWEWGVALVVSTWGVCVLGKRCLFLRLFLEV
nr:hypothetical protein BaRGS_034783 [Batillaria attramentaria]